MLNRKGAKTLSQHDETLRMDDENLPEAKLRAFAPLR
jgi:hypothetical protein